MKIDMIKSIFIWLAAIVSLFVLNKFYLSMQEPEEPQIYPFYRILQEEMKPALEEEIRQKRVNGFVVPLEYDGRNLHSLSKSQLEDFHLLLMSVQNWKLMVSEEQQQAMRDRLQRAKDQWGNLINDNELLQILNAQSHAALQSNYSLDASIFTQRTGDRDRMMVLSVFDEKNQTRLFQLHQSFQSDWSIFWTRFTYGIHRFLYNYRSTWSFLYGVMLFLVIVSFPLKYLILFLLEYRRKSIQQNELANLRGELRNAESLLKQGSFSTVMELCDAILERDEYDFKVKALKDRLLIITQNDPVEAERLFLRTQLRAHELRASKESMLKLNSESQQEIEQLLPLQLNPELEENWFQYMAAQRPRLSITAGEEDEHES